MFRGRQRSRSADPVNKSRRQPPQQQQQHQGGGVGIGIGRNTQSLSEIPAPSASGAAAIDYGYGVAPPSVQQQYGYDQPVQQQSQPPQQSQTYQPQFGTTYSSDDDLYSQDTQSFYGNTSTRSFATGSSSGMRRLFGGGSTKRGKSNKNKGGGDRGAQSRSPPPPSSRSGGNGPPKELLYYNPNQNGHSTNHSSQQQPQQRQPNHDASSSMIYGYQSDQEYYPRTSHSNHTNNVMTSNVSTHSAPPIPYISKRSSNPLKSNFSNSIDHDARSSNIKPFDPHELIQVLPNDAYPDTFWNYSQMETDMNLKSAHYHDLRLPSPQQKALELGVMRVEILQCFGLPSCNPSRDPCAYAIVVLGSLAFKTDIMPPVSNPMWLSKMRRACLFPIQAAYHRLYVGVFDNGISDACITHRAEDFLGRISIDIARLRPGTMYDVLLPLRQSTHVYTKQPQGCVRVRLHLMWASERNALLSYLPRKIPGGTVTWSRRTPNTHHTINCVDDKSVRDVAHTVHGTHMPGKFAVTLLKGTIREINFTRIHLLRYMRQKEWWQLRYWQYPTISLFVFLAWMHACWYGTVRYVPGHVVVFLFLHLIKNYAYYVMDSPLQNGFVVPTAEELYLALMRGTKRRRKPCIAPLTVEAATTNHNNEDNHDENHNHMDTPIPSNARLLTIHGTGLGVDGGSGMNTTDDDFQPHQKFHKGYLLVEISSAMMQSVKLTPYRYKFKLYRTAFLGSDAVEYLIFAGYAYSRPEAVHLGRRLAKECQLFEHIEHKYLLEDEPYVYYFLNRDEDRYTIKQGHAPQGTKLLETMGFYNRRGSVSTNKPVKVQNGTVPAFPPADILEPREHVEFPFATGHDHPRFTIKESIVTESTEAKKILKEQLEAAELTEAAEFGVLAKDIGVNPNQQWDDSENGEDAAAGVPIRRMSIGGTTQTDQRGSNEGMLGAAVGATTRTVRRASLLATTTVNTAVNTAVSTAQTTVSTASTMATSAVSLATNLPNNLVNTLATPRGQGPVEEALQVGDPEEIYDKLRSKKNPTLDYMLERQRQANEHDPYVYDSDNDVEEVQKRKRKGTVIEEKQLKKPPNQDFSRKLGKGDKVFSKTIVEARHKVHAMFYHMFNDHVYKIDKHLFPTIIKEDANKDALANGKKKKLGLFNRRKSNEEDKDELERRKKAQMTPYDYKQDELDRILFVNKYSNSNPWINRVAAVIQPILEMAQAPLFLFRALFNIFTWQDPILTFWITFLCPALALALYLVPYRVLCGIMGMYWLGPQNYVIRLYQESRPGYQPPDFDKIVKKKKVEKDASNYHELQFFSSEAPGNQRIRFKNVDPVQVKQVVVPTNVLRYHRFYDWPPEPEFARAYASAPPRNQYVSRVGPAGSVSDDDSDTSGMDSDAYYYDASTARIKKKKKKKKQGLKKVAHSLKKGTQAGFDATLQATGAIYSNTGMQNVVDVAARTSTGAIKGTAKLSKQAVKGTAKNTAGLFGIRRRKKNKYDDDEYY